MGRSVLEQLCQENHEILILGRKTIPIGLSTVCWKSSDLNQPSSFRKHIIDFAPEAFIHLAWQDLPDFSLSTSLLNLQQSLNLLQTVLELKSCKKILVAGTCWEVNKQLGECLESEFGSSKDHFTWAKHSLRNWLEMETSRRGVSLGWMRIFYVYGPMQRKVSLLPTIMTELWKHRLPPINNPHNANDFVFVEDVTNGFVRALEREFQREVFHLGSGHSTPVWELCQTAEKLICGSSALTEKLLKMNPKPTQSVVNFWANCERSNKLLGWTPQTTLESGIQKTWEWMQTA